MTERDQDVDAKMQIVSKLLVELCHPGSHTAFVLIMASTDESGLYLTVNSSFSPHTTPDVLRRALDIIQHQEAEFIVEPDPKGQPN